MTRTLCIITLILSAIIPNNGFAQGGRFVENKGQFHDNVQYRAQLPYGKVFLEYSRFTYLFYDQSDYDALNQHPKIELKDSYNLHSHAFRINFIGAKPYPLIKANKKGQGYHNYFLGKDPTKWKSRVSTYDEILYQEVYPNIDLKYYTQNGMMKYDWIIKSGGNIEDIVMQYEGVDSIEIIKNELHIHTSVNTIIETIPLCYYQTGEGISKTECSYQINGNEVRFNIPDLRNKSTLVIDPKLIFSTYSGSFGDNFGFTATYDSKGNLYAGGITNGEDPNGSYPVTNGAFQTTFGGGGSAKPPANLHCDVTISKYDSSGQTLLYASFLGGAQEEYPHSLVVNSKDELFIFGTTFSTDFPVLSNAYQNKASDTIYTTEIYVTKVSEDGTKLLGSTYIGGNNNDGLTTGSGLMYNYSDDYRGDIIPDADGNVYIATCTQSSNFPVTTTEKDKPGLDGIVFQFNANLSQLLWSTYVGGKLDDGLYSVKLDDKENIYVAGGTESDDLPTDTASLQKDFGGLTDGFIAKYSNSDKSLKQLSYWGTPQKDQIYFIQLDQRGNLFAMGQTEGNVTPSPKRYNNPNTGQFILKLDTQLSKIELQTVVGKRPNNPDISPSAFLIDHCDNIYISGWGSDVHPQRHGGSTIDLPITPGAIQPNTDGEDFYLMVLRKDMDSLLYATYFGGTQSGDHVDGGTSRFDKRGVVYQSVCSSCSNKQSLQDFPISPGAAFEVNNSLRCSNAAFKIDLQISSAVIANFDPNPKIGCNPLGVQFTNTSLGGVSYEWDFGDGGKDTLKHPFHTYTKPGEYTITLRVIDSFACNIFDETTRVIEVVDSSHANFDVSYNACTREFTLENTSQNAEEFYWDFDNGETSTERSPKYVYDDFGTYDIKLIANPGTLCADSITKNININDLALDKLEWGNIITPNGDGKNDCFGVYGLQPDCNKLELKIVNRWGQLLYESKELTACWNGVNRLTSTIVPDGTYFYVLKVEVKGGKTIEAHGTVTVIQ